jgi:hypothetical protein
VGANKLPFHRIKILAPCLLRFTEFTADLNYTSLVPEHSGPELPGVSAWYESHDIFYLLVHYERLCLFRISRLNYLAGLQVLCSSHVFQEVFYSCFPIPGIHREYWRKQEETGEAQIYQTDLLTASSSVARGPLFKPTGDLKPPCATCKGKIVFVLNVDEFMPWLEICFPTELTNNTSRELWDCRKWDAHSGAYEAFCALGVNQAWSTRQ